jgi:pimeloyl-ACP methyl ester carboxylesterase
LNQSLAAPRQESWQVNGLEISGLSWGRPGDKPLLALHGWLDNAASFAPLAPLLAGYHIVALDLTGHGQSSHRSPDASYQIWDDLPEVQAVLEQLAWDSFDLVGHSRGAIISAIYSAASPERVRRLVLLDSVVPMAVPESDFAVQLRKGLDEKVSYQHRDVRVFASPDIAIEARRQGGLGEEAAALIARRNVKSCDGGYCWTTDSRLRGASAVKLTQGQIEAVLVGLTMPTLLLTEKGGIYRAPELLETVRALVPNLESAEFTGGHHFHMEGDLQAVAGRILAFLGSGCERSKA